LNGIAFLFVLYHTITWFHLTPKALVVRLGGKRVPDSLLLALNYLAWIALSAAVVWIMRG
jgi:fumarate reductase subunit C